MNYLDMHPDTSTEYQRNFMDEHMDDWFIPDEDIYRLSSFEYACWHDDCFDENYRKINRGVYEDDI